MLRNLKFGNVLTCEHVVPGVMGKPTLVGVYAGDILIQSMPGTITMGIYAEHFPDECQNGNLTLSLMLGKQNIGKIVANVAEGDGKTGIIAIPFVPIQVTKNTRFKVIASCEGFKSKVIVNQKISLGILPTISSPTI